MKKEKTKAFSFEAVKGSAIEKSEDFAIIKGAKFIGFESRNGRLYSAVALEQAVKDGLYDDVSLYDLHPDRYQRNDPSFERGQDRYIGKTENARFVSGEGVIGDLRISLSNEACRTFLWRAEHDPTNIALSHECTHSIPVERDSDGKQVIDTIYEVSALATTSKPATTNTLFESIQNERADEMALTDAQLQTVTAEQLKKIPAFVAVSKSVESQSKELDELREKVKSLESERDSVAQAGAIEKARSDLSMTDLELDYLKGAGKPVNSFESIEKGLKELRALYGQASASKVTRKSAESFESAANESDFMSGLRAE